MKNLAFSLGVIGVVLWIGIWFAIYGFIGYAIYHFAAKFW